MIIIQEDQSGQRLDAALTDLTEETRSTIQNWIKEERVWVNGQLAKASLKVKAGDTITYQTPEIKTLELTPVNLNLAVVFEDEDLLVINKPKGLTVHPSGTSDEVTMVHGLLYQVKDLGAFDDTIRPGIVHRLDKDTSGLLLVAKNKKTLLALQKDLQDRLIKREYKALVEGRVVPDKGMIEAPIGRHPTKRQSMTVIAGGKDAVTHFEVIHRYQEMTLLKCQLETGRTHQIRVHFHHIGHPVYNDPKYGGKKGLKDGQFLHAFRLSFNHPTTGKPLSFEAPLPDVFENVLKTLT
jgi:23S rRNA pseudouridine1911/1915/1917 synthase